MIALSKAKRYEPEIKRLTKSNSLAIQDRIIYIAKKDYQGKAVKIFVAYDYKTKVQLYANFSKELIVDYLKEQDLSILEELDG